MKTFSETERQCQAAFSMCGEVYHAYTSGKEIPIVFKTDEELAFSMNAIAYAAYKLRDSVRIIAFEVMNNHFHFVLCGSKDDILVLFRCIVRKLKRTVPLAGQMKLSLKPIADLASMRNNIVYTNRNGYVANPNYTPFSYPWGTGRYYFNDVSLKSMFSDIGYTQNRIMFRGDNVKLPADWQVVDTCSTYGETTCDVSKNVLYVAPVSYCSIDLGMAMFRDAHHYFSAISKNVEAYSEMALELDDAEFLTDQELFGKLLQRVKEQYQLSSLRDISKAQRLDLARVLRYEFRSSNSQIRRVLGLSPFDVDSLFPMSGKGNG